MVELHPPTISISSGQANWTCKYLHNSCNNVEYFCIFQSNKPLMEKRRRERINSSLEQLKQLVLEALNRDVSGQTCLTRFLLILHFFSSYKLKKNFGSHCGNKFSFAVCSKNFRPKPVGISVGRYVGIRLPVQSLLVGIS